MKTKKSKPHYEVIHSDPCRWVFGPCIERTSSLKEAKRELKKLLTLYPLSRQGSARIQKVQVVYKHDTNKE